MEERPASLHRELVKDAMAEVELAERVAGLLIEDVPKAQIARDLGVETSEVRAAVKRLERVAARLERE